MRWFALSKRAGPDLSVGIGAASIVNLVCYAILVAATVDGLIHDAWRGSDQGHGPIIVCVGAWLVWRRLREPPLHEKSGSVPGLVTVGVSLLLYVVGRSQGVLAVEYLALIGLGCGAIHWLWGLESLWKLRFPIFFLLFATPLPEPLVAAITGPLRLAVSATAAGLLDAAGYEVGRTGVLLAIGPYQLLVAEACAGLNTMFTLEALGVLYLNLTPRTSFARSAALATLLIPIAFLANVVRVCVLVLVTYYFGDAAGQGFVHDFAGLVLFAVALGLLVLCDSALVAMTRPAGRGARVQSVRR